MGLAFCDAGPVRGPVALAASCDAPASGTAMGRSRQAVSRLGRPRRHFHGDDPAADHCADGGALDRHHLRGVDRVRRLCDGGDKLLRAGPRLRARGAYPGLDPAEPEQLHADVAGRGGDAGGGGDRDLFRALCGEDEFPVRDAERPDAGAGPDPGMVRLAAVDGLDGAGQMGRALAGDGRRLDLHPGLGAADPDVDRHRPSGDRAVGPSCQAAGHR